MNKPISRNRHSLFAAAFTIAIAVTASAQGPQSGKQDLILKSGKVLKDAEFVTQDPVRGIKVQFADGIAWVKISDLPVEFLSKQNLAIPEALAKTQLKAEAEREKINSFKIQNPTFRDRDGTVYQSSDIVALEPTSLKLERSGMVRRIDFEKLPPDVVQFFGYDAATVALEKERIASLSAQNKKLEEARQSAASILDGSKASVALDLVQKVENGYICSGHTFTMNSKDVEVNRRFNALANKWIFDTKRVEFEEIGETLPPTIVMGLPPSFLETRKWKGAVWFGGMREYTNLTGKTVTARLAFTSRELGMNYIVEHGFQIEKESGSAARSTKSSPSNTDSGPIGTGTGFFISDDGYIATNDHVVKDARKISVKTTNATYVAKLIKSDSVNDLAIIKVEGSFSALPIAPSRGVKLGDTVATLGFPNPDLQGFSPKLSKGEIASLSGTRDDARYFQISVAVQPGNSGGALVDQRGNVVGIVSAKLSARAALATSGKLPENVNYAVKSGYLMSLLESVPDVQIKEPSQQDEDFSAIVERIKDRTVLVIVN